MGHNARSTGQPPWPTQPGVDRQDRIAVPQDMVAVDDKNGIRIGWVDTMLAKESCANIALHRRQTITARRVMRQDELRIGRTEDAFGIKKDDWVGFRHRNAPYARYIG